MSYQTIKWILFTVLFLTVPAMLFLVQAVMFMPAIFFLAGIAHVISKLFVLGHATESLWFILFLGVHFLVYGGAYYLVSALAAKILTMIRTSLVRNCTVGVLCLGLGSLTQFSIYGGGGHGPMHWDTLWEVLKGINQSYGAGTVEIVYGVTLLLLSAFLLNLKLRGSRS